MANSKVPIRKARIALTNVGTVMIFGERKATEKRSFLASILVLITGHNRAKQLALIVKLSVPLGRRQIGS
jgi:L-lactate utilization protein LutC